MMVSKISAYSTYNLLVPPSEGPIGPRILAVHKPQNDLLVECVIIELVVLVVLCSLWGQAELSLSVIKNAESDLKLGIVSTHHNRCISDVLRRYGCQCVHLTNAMVPGHIFLFDILHIHWICTKQDVNQCLKIVWFLVHVNKVIAYGWTYAYQELPLEESLLWIIRIVLVVFVQEDQHVGPPYLVGPSIVHSPCAGHDLSVQVDAHSTGWMHIQIRVCIPFAKVVGRDEQTSILNAVQAMQRLVRGLRVYHDWVFACHQVSNRIIFHLANCFGAGHVASCLHL